MPLFSGFLMVTMTAKKVTEPVCSASVDTEAHRRLGDSLAWGQMCQPDHKPEVFFLSVGETCSLSDGAFISSLPRVYTWSHYVGLCADPGGSAKVSQTIYLPVLPGLTLW